MAETEGRRERDLDLVEEFETVRAVTSDGRSVRIPKSKIGGSIEVATENVLGGIKASPKSDTDTKEVKIDPATGRLYVQEGEGTPPDDEDITVAEIEGVGKLQFNDKAYNASSYSGLGRTYLRKNMVNGKNVLTQAMFTNDDGSVRSNTRYIIQYDYDLNGDTISIPEGCVLDFEGGSIKGDGFVLKNYIVYGAQIGLIPNNESYSKHNANKIVEVLNLGAKLIIDNIYYIESTDTIVNHVNIQGINRETSKLIVTNFGSQGVFVINNSVDLIRVSNLSIDTTASKGYMNFNRLFNIKSGATPNLMCLLFDNLKVSGVRLITFNVPDVDMSTWGIDEIHFSDIDADNIDSLALMNNLPYNLFVIERVRVFNFYKTIISAGTTNEYSNQSSLYANKVIIRDCYIENDYISTEIISYLTLAVIEAVECHYYNNIAKNIVCTNNTPTYDSYLTCDVLYYINNTSINVVGLETGGNVDIYKCKMTVGKKSRTVRHIAHNSYLLQKSYFEDNNISDLKWKVKLGNFQSNINVVEFIGNIVNIELGVFSFGNFIVNSESVIISDNTIKAIDGTTASGSSLVSLAKNSSIDIINNKFNLGHITNSNQCPVIFRQIYNIEGVSVRILNNVMSNCDMFSQWEEQNVNYSIYKQYIELWEVSSNCFSYYNSTRNNVYKFHEGKMIGSDNRDYPITLTNTYSITDTTMKGEFRFYLQKYGDYVEGRSNTYQYVGKFPVKDRFENFVIQLTYEDSVLVKTKYENSFGFKEEYNNQDFTSAKRVYISDSFVLYMTKTSTMILASFNTDSKFTLNYVDSHTNLNNYFIVRGGLWTDKPTSTYVNLKPHFGQSYLCTDKSSAESENQGLMIYYKGVDSSGKDVWIDSLGRIVI